MKPVLYVAICLTCLLLPFSVWSQNGHLKKGDKYYEKLVYPEAVYHYEKALKKAQDLRAMERLADSYEQLSNLEKAEQWFAEVVKTKGATPVDKIRYALTLKANGKYAEARKWFEAYLETGENPGRAARMIESCDFAVEGKKDSLRYQISPEPLNTKGSEFGPVLFQQGLIFVAQRRPGGKRVMNVRNDDRFYDLYYAERKPGSKSGVKVKSLKGKVNRKFHEGPADLANKQTMLYFTRSNFVKEMKGMTTVNQSRLKIFATEYIRKKWKNLTSMPFNSESYSCGHPTLSPDGNTMVFASDILGGFGGTDLYLVTKDSSGWGSPKNLGSNINTEGDEQFPYLHSGGTLFFASTGQPGFGGFDIFAASKEGAMWGKATNAGYGVNSSHDDFSITWMPGKSSGYFASNRTGDDNIYMFKRQMKMNGTIVDRRSGKPLEAVSISILDASGKETKYVTDAKGQFSHVAEWGKEYLVNADKSAYLTVRERLNTSEVSPLEDLNRTFQMEEDLVLAVLGQVTDADTKTPIVGASVRVIGSKERPLVTDAQGNYYAQVEAEKEYAVIVQRAGYVPQIFNFSTEGKKKSEDFKFNAPLQKGNAVLLQGKAFVKENNASLQGVNVRAIDIDQQLELRAALTRKDGRFWMVTDPKVEQVLIGSKVGYFASRAELPKMDSTTTDTTINVEIGMVPYEIGALVKTIYYDYNKSDIKRLGTEDLLEIVYFLQDNPEASVQLSSYTDSRGGDSYNAQLSQRRADAAVNYIVRKGVENKRVAAKGFGETNLVNKCIDGVECTDEEHAANRRTEIRITKLDLGMVPQEQHIGYFAK
jgi:outer membrane protein OmpA-like peptidoglycan-associated protein